MVQLRLLGKRDTPLGVQAIARELKLVPSTCLIWSEVSYLYKPTIGYVVTNTLTLKDQMYMRPRQSDCVTYPTT